MHPEVHRLRPPVPDVGQASRPVHPSEGRTNSSEARKLRAPNPSRVVLAVLFLAATLSAAHPDPWLKITSANFELYTTAGERSGRDLVRHFEQVRSFFLQAFGSRLTAGRPARIIAFRNEKEYLPYRPNEFAAAFFQPGAVHDFIVMSSASSDHYPTAVHEYTHLMIRQSGMELPAWLNEGLAELYSSLEPRGDKILVGQLLPGRVQALHNDRWIPLADLLTVDHTSKFYNERSHAGMFYAESWALVHMLNLDPAYRPQLKAFVLALKQEDPEEAFAKVYGKQLAEVEAALRTYFDGNTIRAQLFDVQLPKSVDAPEIQAAASLPARLALAELLSNNRGKADQANAAFEQLSKDYPDRWEVEEARGQYDWQTRQLPDAAKHLARAVELGCKTQSGLLLYARVLGYNKQPKEEAEVLTRAVALYPDSDEVNLELGATHVRNGSYGAAVSALSSVKKVATAGDAYRLYYNLAYAQYRLGDPERAKESSAKARGYTRNPAEIAALDRLQQSLDRSAPEPSSVEGTLETMECGPLARLHIRVAGTIKIFAIPDPTKVAFHGAGGEAVELQCGPQKPPRAVHLEYQSVPAIPGVTGLIRTLEFR